MIENIINTKSKFIKLGAGRIRKNAILTYSLEESEKSTIDKPEFILQIILSSQVSLKFGYKSKSDCLTIISALDNLFNLR